MDLEADEGFWIDADSDKWIPVPLAFPVGHWRDVREWVAETSAALRAGIEMPPDVAAELVDLAMGIATMEPPEEGAIARLWYFPRLGGAMQLAHLYGASRSDVGTVPLEELGLRSVTELHAQRTEEIEVAGFSRALLIMAVGTLDDEGRAGQNVAAARLIGERDGMILVLEVLDVDFSGIARMESDLVSLFRSIRFGSTTEFDLTGSGDPGAANQGG